jgi:hypothetical protein
MAKRKNTSLHRNRVEKSSAGEDKVSRVLREFKEGKLKSSSGSTVTSKEQAIAIALSAAGLSHKDMEKSELRNKLVSVRKSLENKLEKELSNDKALRSEIIKFFKANPQPTDVQMHGLAERLKIEPPELETLVYSILSDIISGGLSKGKILPVDPKELEMGISTEVEHTSDKDIAEKIARDHLSEDPKYYTKLRHMESDIQKARTDHGYESPEPGDMSEEGKKILAGAYASCRKDGGDKEKCAKIAWSATRKSGH